MLLWWRHPTTANHDSGKKKVESFLSSLALIFSRKKNRWRRPQVKQKDIWVSADMLAPQVGDWKRIKKSKCHSIFFNQTNLHIFWQNVKKVFVSTGIFVECDSSSHEPIIYLRACFQPPKFFLHQTRHFPASCILQVFFCCCRRIPLNGSTTNTNIRGCPQIDSWEGEGSYFFFGLNN